jgi:DNA-directed RNA polymerase subunit beta
MDGEEILTTFYDIVPFEKRDAGGVAGWATPYKPERWRGVKPDFPLIDADTGEEVAAAATKISARQAKRLADNGLKTLLLSPEALVGRYLARDEVNPATGEIYAEAGDELDVTSIAALEQQGFTTIDVLDIDHVTVGAYIRNTLRVDKNAVREDALFDIYRVMRPGEPPTVEAAEAMFKSLFFDQERYDLSSVGRVKMKIARTTCASSARRMCWRSSRRWSGCATAAARSTTSTISATAGSARWANCWRINTASACCAWSGRSRSACRASISTR